MRVRRAQDRTSASDIRCESGQGRNRGSSLGMGPWRKEDGHVWSSGTCMAAMGWSGCGVPPFRPAPRLCACTWQTRQRGALYGVRVSRRGHSQTALASRRSWSPLAADSPSTCHSVDTMAARQSQPPRDACWGLAATRIRREVTTVLVKPTFLIRPCPYRILPGPLYGRRASILSALLFLLPLSITSSCLFCSCAQTGY